MTDLTRSALVKSSSLQAPERGMYLNEQSDAVSMLVADWILSFVGGQLLFLNSQPKPKKGSSNLILMNSPPIALHIWTDWSHLYYSIEGEISYRSFGKVFRDTTALVFDLEEMKAVIGSVRVILEVYMLNLLGGNGMRVEA